MFADDQHGVHGEGFPAAPQGLGDRGRDLDSELLASLLAEISRRGLVDVDRDHVEPGPKVAGLGLTRYGTGFAGSDTYASNALSGFVSFGGSNESLPPALKYSLRALTSCLGGQLSYDFHWFEPDSNVVASASSSLPLSLSQ